MKTLTLYPQPITTHSFAQTKTPCQTPSFNALPLTTPLTTLKGQPKWQIVQNLLKLNLDFVEFVHWLAIPSCDILLHFEHQICTQIQVNYGDSFILHDGHLI